MACNGMAIVVLCVAILFHGAMSRSTEQEERMMHVVPKNIFTFWEGPQSELVQQSLATWRRKSPAWKVHVIGKANLGSYVNISELPSGWERLSVLQLSDLVRLEVVSVRGGVWLDATIALTQPLETWVPDVAPRGELVGFDLDFDREQAMEFSPSGENWSQHFFANGSLRPVASFLENSKARIFESWGFAAPKNCPALRHWRDEFRRAVSFEGGAAGYCEALLEDPAASEYIPASLRRWLPYLTVHVALAKARHDHPEVVVRTAPAESMAFAHLHYAVSWSHVRLQQPTNYIVDGTGGAIIALSRGASESPAPSEVGALLKLRNLDRTAFRCIVAYGAYKADSPAALIFDLPKLPQAWPVETMRFLAAFEARFGHTEDPALILIFGVLRAMVAVAQTLLGVIERYMALCVLGALELSIAVARWKHNRALKSPYGVTSLGL